jgi:hypothetical protein
MGKIKQGILGGFKGKVGTVIGASWNGIAYMKGLPQSQKDPKSAAQMRQRTFFREVQNLVGQLTAEQQRFLIPETPQGMTRRNMLAKQLAEDPVVTDDSKTVDLANLKTIGDAPTADLPDVTVTADTLEGSPVLKMQWDTENDWRSTHGDEYPTIFVANVTQRKIFLVNSTAVVGVSAEASFTVPLAAYGEATDTFSGFMLSTGRKVYMVGFGTLGVVNRPARQGRNPRTGKPNV